MLRDAWLRIEISVIDATAVFLREDLDGVFLNAIRKMWLCNLYRMFMDNVEKFLKYFNSSLEILVIKFVETRYNFLAKRI